MAMMLEIAVGHRVLSVLTGNSGGEVRTQIRAQPCWQRVFCNRHMPRPKVPTFCSVTGFLGFLTGTEETPGKVVTSSKLMEV